MCGIAGGGQDKVSLYVRVFLVVQVILGISAFDDTLSDSPFQLEGNLNNARPVSNERGVTHRISQSVEQSKESWVAGIESSSHEYGKRDSSRGRRRILEDRTIPVVRFSEKPAIALPACPDLSYYLEGPMRLFSPSKNLTCWTEGTLHWNPAPDRFLFMHCEFGQISNRIICYMRSMLYAALLNRTLILSLDPRSIHGGYDRRVVLDIDYIRACLGPLTMMTTWEYAERYGETAVVDEVRCWSGCPVKSLQDPIESAFVGVQDFKFASGLQVSFSDLEQWNVRSEDFVREYGRAEGRMLMLGDAFVNSVDDVLYQEFVPFVRSTSHKCPNNFLIRPSLAVRMAAEKYIESVPELRDNPYIALHLRRGDFEDQCTSERICMHSIEQIAKATLKKMEATGIRNLYLATDGIPKEVSIFLDLIRDHTLPPVHVIHLSMKDPESVWRKELRRGGMKVSSLAVAQIDKLVCMHSTLFLGTAGSTFSLTIEHLRMGYGYAHCADVIVCEDEEPWQ